MEHARIRSGQRMEPETPAVEERNLCSWELPGNPQTQLLSVYFWDFGQTFTVVQPSAQIQNVFITSPLVPSSLGHCVNFSPDPMHSGHF